MESFWKEYTIFLPAKKEFIFDVQNKNTNCVIIRNCNITNIKAGLKPYTYEVFINPNRTGVLNRPFPLRFVYLYTTKPTPISIIETITQNPIDNFIKQKITKNIIAQNAPQVCEKEAYKQIFVLRSFYCPDRGRRARRETRNVTLDCGIYGRPLINIVFISGGLTTWFDIGFSDNNTNYFFPYQNLSAVRSMLYPPNFIRNHINLINTFRFVRVRFLFFRYVGHYVRVQISGIRCHTKTRRQLVTQQDGF